MVIRWRPDTCECIIEYEADGRLTRVVHACAAHQGDNEQTIFQNVKEENPRKNYSVKEIIDNGPSGMFDVDAESGTRIFKKGITVDFEYQGEAPNRTLSVIVKGTTLTANQLNAIQNKLNAKFAGKQTVTVVQG